MTIGVGVLASDPPEPAQPVRPNTLILMADTMGTYGDVYSHDRLHKTMVFGDNDVYMTAADSVDHAAEFSVLINARIAITPIHERTHGSIKHAISTAAFLYKRERFITDVFPQLRLEPSAFDRATAQNLPSSVEDDIKEAWREFDIGCDLLIGAFDYQGQALLYSLAGDEATVQGVSFPGFCCIGTGANNAMFWLGYRRHILGYGTKRAAYHAYEAKLMAEKSAHVNDHLDVCVAQKGKYWGLTSHRPEDWTRTDAPFNLSELKKWYEDFGARSTESLDGPMQSASQKSAGQP